MRASLPVSRAQSAMSPARQDLRHAAFDLVVTEIAFREVTGDAPDDLNGLIVWAFKVFDDPSRSDAEIAREADQLRRDVLEKCGVPPRLAMGILAGQVRFDLASVVQGEKLYAHWIGGGEVPEELLRYPQVLVGRQTHALHFFCGVRDAFALEAMRGGPPAAA